MRKTSWVLILCIVYFIPLMTFGQLVINEFCSKGSVEGFDGENNDWIELINISSSTINLSNYSLSDNINNISKWNFPSVELDSMQKILILCSGEDKKERVTHWESIVNENTFFNQVWLALVKTTIMFIGEIEFGDLPIDSNSWLSYCFLLWFVFLIIVVLMNLLLKTRIRDINLTRKE